MVMLFSACGVDSDRFKLSGRFLNMNQGEFYIYSPDGFVGHIDTIRVMGGRFTYERPCDREAMLVIVFPNFSEQPVFAAPGEEVEIQADASHMKEMVMKGTKDNELMTVFRKQTAALSPPDVKKKAEEFINEHPESPVGLFLVRKFFIQDLPADYTKAATLIGKMLQQQPKNGALIILQKQLSQLRNGVKGASVAKFSGPRLGGGTVSDADLGDQIAVISSWASWNYDSQEMQRQLRRKARSSGGRIKLVSVNLDADRNACDRVVERDSLSSYPIVFDGLLFDSPTFRQTGLCGMNDNIVIDRRKVVAHGLNVNELKEKLDELLEKHQ